MNSSPRRNIEIKARCADLALAERAAVEIGARAAGVLVQVDTYFHVPNGRLKLRETEGKPAELIWYRREDSAAVRASDYYVLPVPAPGETLAALGGALGLRGAVRKRRTLYLWENVRIHLDAVEGLGTFVEFEAVVSDDAPDEISAARVERLIMALKIAEGDRVAMGYAQLLGI